MIEVWAVSFSLILVRVSFFVGMLPLFGGRNLPRLVKVGLSIALAWMWFGSFGMTPSMPMLGMAANFHWFRYAIIIGQEAIFGAMLGFAFGLFLLPARIAGSYIGQEMGLSLATISDPSAQDSANILAQLFESLGILTFFCLDFHHALLGTLHVTFNRWPISSPLSAYPLLPLMNGMADAHEWGLLLAAPLAICLFLTVIVLALMMKASPQMNLFSVGLSLRLGVGLLAALLFLPDICLLMIHVFSQMSSFVHRLL